MRQPIRFIAAMFSAPSRPHETYAAAVLFGIATFIPFVSSAFAAVVSDGAVGWTPAHAAVSLGFYSLGLGIVMTTLWPSVAFLLELRETGWFDLVLLYPTPTVLLIAIVRPYKEAMWLLLYGLFLVGGGAFFGGGVHVVRLIPAAVLFLLGVAGACALVLTVWALAAARPGLRPLMDAIGILLSTARVPEAAYPPMLRTAFFTVFPFGFLSSLPTAAILDGGTLSAAVGPPLLALAALCSLAVTAWYWLIKKYQTGL